MLLDKSSFFLLERWPKWAPSGPQVGSKTEQNHPGWASCSCECNHLKRLEKVYIKKIQKVIRVLAKPLCHSLLILLAFRGLPRCLMIWFRLFMIVHWHESSKSSYYERSPDFVLLQHSQDMTDCNKRLDNLFTHVQLFLCCRTGPFLASCGNTPKDARNFSIVDNNCTRLHCVREAWTERADDDDDDHDDDHDDHVIYHDH